MFIIVYLSIVMTIGMKGFTGTGKSIIEVSSSDDESLMMSH